MIDYYIRGRDEAAMRTTLIAAGAAQDVDGSLSRGWGGHRHHRHLVRPASSRKWGTATAFWLLRQRPIRGPHRVARRSHQGRAPCASVRLGLTEDQ